ncbi:hypothetical protein [Virgisporangium ochraceum]|uniref:Uncharacterized protein n=1 Tax=Virgisporangium ochraceum TaxID=65505 RepID=A0A8J4E980_9ACTN|nr:hypothetical protein [Virgisporangium ochraceum]GIJ66940.1 hypothetical protein Voc01_018570 [Virgisporangium ochraceum]
MKGADTLPFRWDLVAPDQLGTLLSGTESPRLWFVDDLAECAGKVLARSGNGDLVFVGRSLDSMFDLLGGALAGVADDRRLHRLPVSFARSGVRSGRRWRERPLTHGERRRGREFLANVGVTPHALARRARPVTFVDVVHEGGTFTDLFTLLRDWIDEERQPWRVIRRKVRFVGVTIRRETSPNTYRWRHDAGWTRQLPARSVVNVSLDWWVWNYLGDRQTKLTRTFKPERWLAGAAAPDRDLDTRQAIAEAVAIVHYGRSAAGRKAIARAADREPALAEAWLRTVVTALNST